MSEWQEVAAQADIPDESTLLVDVGNDPVCLYNLDGEIFATHDTCSHGQASLADGFLVDGLIECPLHQGTFDVKTGKARGAPCKVDIKTYAVKLDGGKVFVKT